MTTKEKYELIDKTKINEKILTILRNMEQSSSNFTDEAVNSKIDGALEKLIEQIRANKPEALRTLPEAKKEVKKEKEKAIKKNEGKDFSDKKDTDDKTGLPKKDTLEERKDIIKEESETEKEARDRAKKELEKEKEKAKDEVESQIEKLNRLILEDPALQGFNTGSAATGGGRSTPIIDAERKALPRGSRVSQKGWMNQHGASKGGRKYWENRENRSDRKSPEYETGKPYLAKGGNVYSSDEMYLIAMFKGDVDLDTISIRAKNKAEARMIFENNYRDKYENELGDFAIEIYVVKPFPESDSYAQGGVIKAKNISDWDWGKIFEKVNLGLGESFVTILPKNSDGGKIKYGLIIRDASNQFDRSSNISYIFDLDDKYYPDGRQSVKSTISSPYYDKDKYKEIARGGHLLVITIQGNRKTLLKDLIYKINYTFFSKINRRNEMDLPMSYPNQFLYDLLVFEGSISDLVDFVEKLQSAFQYEGAKLYTEPTPYIMSIIWNIPESTDYRNSVITPATYIPIFELANEVEAKTSKKRKYADGGEVEGVDLFEDYDDQPEEVQAILANYEMEDNDYETLQNLKAELESIGYTMEFGLDAEPYDLRKIGEKGKSEFYAKGGKLNTEVVLTENRSNGAKWRGVVKPFMMKSIEQNQYGGGFKRYEIDIYDDKVKREPSKEELKEANEFFDKVGGRFAHGGEMPDGYMDDETLIHEFKETLMDTDDLQRSIKEYYVNAFPTDDEGFKIEPDANFAGLNMALTEGDDVYKYLGVTDSLVRERVFEKLSEILGVDYDVVYNMWLRSDKYDKGGQMADGGKMDEYGGYKVTFQDNTEDKLTWSEYVYANSEPQAVLRAIESLSRKYPTYHDFSKMEVIEIEEGEKYAKGGETEDYYENLAVYVRGRGEIYRGTSMKKALAVANDYKRKNSKAKIVVVDDKIGDEYDLNGNLTGIRQKWYFEYAKGGMMADGGEMELYYVKDSNGNVKNISKTNEDASKFLEKSLKYNGSIGYAVVPKEDWEKEKVTVANIKQYAKGGIMADGGETDDDDTEDERLSMGESVYFEVFNDDGKDGIIVFRNDGSNIIEALISGDIRRFTPKRYMSYLTKKDLQRYLNRDFNYVEEVDEEYVQDILLQEEKNKPSDIMVVKYPYPEVATTPDTLTIIKDGERVFDYEPITEDFTVVSRGLTYPDRIELRDFLEDSKSVSPTQYTPELINIIEVIQANEDINEIVNELKSKGLIKNYIDLEKGREMADGGMLDRDNDAKKLLNSKKFDAFYDKLGVFKEEYTKNEIAKILTGKGYNEDGGLFFEIEKDNKYVKYGQKPYTYDFNKVELGSGDIEESQQYLGNWPKATIMRWIEKPKSKPRSEDGHGDGGELQGHSDNYAKGGQMNDGGGFGSWDSLTIEKMQKDFPFKLNQLNRLLKDACGDRDDAVITNFESSWMSKKYDTFANLVYEAGIYLKSTGSDNVSPSGTYHSQQGLSIIFYLRQTYRSNGSMSSISIDASKTVAGGMEKYKSIDVENYHDIYKYISAILRDNPKNNLGNFTYAKGGEMENRRTLKFSDAVLYKDEMYEFVKKDGELGFVSHSQGAWGMNGRFLPLGRMYRSDLEENLTDMYGNKFYIPNYEVLMEMPYGFAKGGMMADGGYTESGEKLYEIANNMSDKEFQEAYRNLSQKEKDLYESLLRLGDESKIALVTVLNESKKPKYNKVTWDLHRYAKGGEMAKGGITPQLNDKVHAKAQEILKAEGITENISQKQFNQAYDKAIKEFGYSPAYFKKVMREFGSEYPDDDNGEFGDFMADGGMMGDGNSVDAEGEIIKKGDKVTNGRGLVGIVKEVQTNGLLYIQWISANGAEIRDLMSDNDPKELYIINDKYGNGGMMADGGMLDDEGNLIDIKIGDEVVEYKKRTPNATEKTPIGPKGRVIKIMDNFAKVSFPNDYEENILLRDLKKMSKGGMMADGGIRLRHKYSFVYEPMLYTFTVELNNSEDELFEFETMEQSFRFARVEEKEGNRITDVSKYKKIGFQRYEREQELLDKYKEWTPSIVDEIKINKSRGYRYADGGMMADGGEVDFNERMAKMRNAYENLNMIVKSRIAVAIGIDRAISIMENDYSIDPFGLITSAVRSGLLELDEINKDLVNEAVYEAERVTDDYRDSGQGIGGSDMTYFTKSVLDGVGYKTGFVNNRLTRVDADGNELVIDKYEMNY